MKTITINLFPYEELSAEAKKVALNRFQDINVMDRWWENVYEDAANVGIRITSFNERYWPEIECIQSFLDTANEIIENHGVYTDTYQSARDFLTGLNTKNDFYIRLRTDYSKILMSEYDYLTSDSAIEQTIVANEYHFTEKGEYYHED